MTQDNTAAALTARDLHDDKAALAELWVHLKPKGTLIITVPAYMWLWSGHDEAVHHRRRYTRSQLTHLLESSGYRVRRASYYTSVLLPLMAAQRLLTRLADQLRKNREISYQTRTPPAPLNALLDSLMSLERAIIRRLSLPFGGSLIVECEPATRDC